MKRPFYKVRTIKFQMESAGPPAPSTPSYATPMDPEERKRKRKMTAMGVGAGVVGGAGVGYGLYHRGKKEIEKQGHTLVNPKAVPGRITTQGVSDVIKEGKKQKNVQPPAPNKLDRQMANRWEGLKEGASKAVKRVKEGVKGAMNLFKSTKNIAKNLPVHFPIRASEAASYLIRLGEQIYNVR